jgi:predicted DNA-binding protein
MNRTAVTLRINAEERNALKNLSKIEGRPINQILNDAIKSYLRQQGEKERRLEATLNSLKAYRKKDPEFKRALAEFVEAEATLNDPLEGTPFEEGEAETEVEIENAARNIRKSAGALQSRIQSAMEK